MNSAEERAQLIATQVAEHIRQSVAPVREALDQFAQFLRESVEGVYVGDVKIPCETLFAEPLQAWAELVKQKVNPTETATTTDDVPVAVTTSDE